MCATSSKGWPFPGEGRHAFPRAATSITGQRGAEAEVAIIPTGARAPGTRWGPRRPPTETKFVTHARYVIFQMPEVAIPPRLFRAILERIRRLRLPAMVPR